MKKLSFVFILCISLAGMSCGNRNGSTGTQTSADSVSTQNNNPSSANTQDTMVLKKDTSKTTR